MTTTSTAPPFVADGVVAVSCVEPLKTTLAAAFAFTDAPKTSFDGSSTKATAAPLTKLLPLIVTDVPPARPPEEGETVEIAGAAGTMPPLRVARQEAFATSVRTESMPN